MIRCNEMVDILMVGCVGVGLNKDRQIYIQIIRT